jgi:hypothetical protein
MGDYWKLIANKYGITDPINGSWIQPIAYYFGATDPVNGSWIQAIADAIGVSSINGNWIQPIAISEGATGSVNGSWLQALYEATGGTPSWSPDDISNLELWYHRSDESTFNSGSITDGTQVNTWMDKSTNGLDMTQITSTKQPIYGATAVSFDGVDDILSNSTTNLFGTHEYGAICFSGYAFANSWYFSSCDTSTTTSHIRIAQRSTGELGIVTSVSPGGGNYYQGQMTTTQLTDGDYFYAIIYSDGSNWYIRLNGVEETLQGWPSAVPPFEGKWFADIPSRDNIAFGGMIRSSTTTTKCSLDKLIYYYKVLTPTEITDIETWLSDPNN